MKVLVTGSAGHLGRALTLTLPEEGHVAVGIDQVASGPTGVVGSITDVDLVRQVMEGVDVVLHTATLHKPHVATHARREFVATNIEGTLTLLEAAVDVGVGAFVLTSTTSTFGRAMQPAPGSPAVWVDEDLVPQPKNIYGATKVAAEDLAELVHRDHGLPVVVLRTSRFFPEADDQPDARAAFTDANRKVNELLNRRADLADVVDAHLRAAAHAPAIGFARAIVTATTPFGREDVAELAVDAPAVIARVAPRAVEVYERLGWSLPPTLDRVYDNDRARRVLGWRPRWDFATAVDRLAAGEEPRSALTDRVGSNGYHPVTFADGPYPL